MGQAYLLDNRINSDTKELEELRLMSQTISSPGFEEHYNASRNIENHSQSEVNHGQSEGIKIYFGGKTYERRKLKSI